ncbi:hypothetical protein LPJ61_002655 [Coemansia biformis]|uniref:Phospholipid scramblase n=1 Tax=Coemansia biformis TaxID=1286918 RepID=A0A9W8CX06_9FUNG|nr:hypothetical protein LPJ61_002655 [Coemansia biformis]
MLNVFLGYEQANRYTLVDPQGRTAGFMVEERSLASEIGRQIYRLHRPFRVLVMDANGSVCLEIRRGFSFINSRISVVDSAGTVIGESQQEWHPWRRRYNLFTQSEQKEFDQFARVDAPFLSWDFPMVDEHGAALGGVFRGFAGIGTELFTDYGLYSLCLSRAALEQRAAVESAARSGRVAGLPLAEREMDLDRRAVALAAAVSIDFDYFSRHSRFGAGAPLGITLFPLSSANHGGHPSDPGDSGAHDGYDEF